MILGIDAGGTNYDGVVLEDGVVATAKKPSDEADAFEALLDELLENVDTVNRVVVSTTRVLNSAVQDTLPDCTNIVVPGVGLSPELAYAGDENLVADGCVDHRGRLTEPLDVSDVEPSHGTVAVTAKFSTRNPKLEKETVESVDAQTVALGHESGGALGFPARAETTVANAKSKPVFADFVSSLHDALEARGVDAPVYYLKGDSAMLSRDSAKATPAHTLRSGPASSSLGLVALSGVDDAVCVDVGGTTTDVTLVEDGFPSLTEGVCAGRLSTFYEGVVSVDATVGGDTRVDEDGLTGTRDGSPAAFGGPSPTPTDALRVLGETSGGDEEKARAALSTLGEPDEVARETAKEFVTAVVDAVESLESRSGTVVLGGALASALADRLADRLDWANEVVVPVNAEVCGAVGCVVARVSVKTHVHVDTARGEMTVASAGPEKVEKVERGKEYGDDEARELVKRETAEATRRAGGEATPDEVEVKSLRSFNVVQNGRVVGTILDAEAQAQPDGSGI
ncbi:MAG: hydantoinase/oxoprolinase family protein [Halobacteriales archaeon]|nr:hydantoinase/oxoprolinase family protein [Halobacteriales archaeon]